MTGCSTSKNTSSSRWWHSFNARYNTYYNAAQAYISGSLEKENSNKDNFTDIIPLYTVANKNSKELGSSNYKTAIEKCEKVIHRHSIKHRPEWTKNRRKTARDIEWLNRKEYNPFIWKAWLLMGRSQFFSGQFEDAASTFSYMSRMYETQPAIYGRARAWLAKCYIEQGWNYDAENVTKEMSRDSIDWRAQKEWDYTYADYYIHVNNFPKAIPYLRKVIRYEMRRKQKAREWYLMGQLQAALGNNIEASKAFKHVIRLNPPYELKFNAQISMTEVMAAGQSGKMISRLNRMATSDNNKDYLDQVYYAIGNIYLAEKDTTKAIMAYEKGNKKATRQGIEKGVLLLHLGDLYWAKEQFSDAGRCYGEAIGLLDKDRKDYKQLSERSKILDELVPFTNAVHLQDSLQSLAKMNEKDRNAAIDRVIENLKKKEKEERDKEADNNTLAIGKINQSGNNNQNRKTSTTSNNQNTTWYFYNQMAVNQGKTAFTRLWGKRENVDNWQRNNKTVVAGAGDNTELTDEMRDSIFKAQAMADSLKNISDSAINNPHKREFYLAQIPFSEEQILASNKIIEDGLYNSGVIFKDKLDNMPLSEKNLRRLVDHYPDYEHLDNAYYHLFLLYSRMNNKGMADNYLQKLKTSYPKSQWTAILSDPYFAENAKFGTHIEDSLYAATYDAFKAGNYTVVTENCKISNKRFLLGANRDKFLFIEGMTKLNNGDANGCVSDMKTVVDKYPESSLSEMAGMIVNGVNQGKRLHGAKFDIGEVWDRRSVVLNDSDKTNAKKFSNERNTNFSFIIAYKPDSVNENLLLFDLAKFNFTCFLVRNFDITIEDADGVHRMKVSGFRNFDEALQYANLLYKQENIIKRLAGCRCFVISDTNAELLGTTFTYNDYDTFYAKHFAPLKVRTFRLLTEPVEIETEKEPEPTQEDIDKALDNKDSFDNGLDIDLNSNDKSLSPDNGLLIIPEGNDNSSHNDDTLVIPAEKANTIKEDNQTTVKENDAIIIPEEKSATTTDNNTLIIPEEKVKVSSDDNTLIIPEEKVKVSSDDNTLIIPEEKTKVPSDDNTLIIPEEKVSQKATDVTNKEKATEEIKTEKTSVVPNNENTSVVINNEKERLVTSQQPIKTNVGTNVTKSTEKVETVKKENIQSNGKVDKKIDKSSTKEQSTKSQTEDTGIYFDDGFNSGTQSQKEKKNSEKKKEFDLEDEYYDLEGF